MHPRLREAQLARLRERERPEPVAVEPAQTEEKGATSAPDSKAPKKINLKDKKA